jgi:hypothetical protein
MKSKSLGSYEGMLKDQPRQNTIDFYKTMEIFTGYSGGIFDYYYKIYDSIGNEQRNLIRIKITDWCISRWEFKMEDLECILLQCAKEEVVKRLELGILEEVSIIELTYETILPNYL